MGNSYTNFKFANDFVLFSTPEEELQENRTE